MRALLLIVVLCVGYTQSQQWNQLLATWTRKGKSLTGTTFTIPLTTTTRQHPTTQQITNDPSTTNPPQTKTTVTEKSTTIQLNTTQPQTSTSSFGSTFTLASSTNTPTFTTSFPKNFTTSTSETSTMSEGSTFYDTTTPDYTATTGEPREGPNSHEFYLSRTERPNLRITSNISQNLLPLPAGADAALVKPTKYHYYPHNQHIYLLPECAIQQVCNAVYVRLNWTQPLCACLSRYRDPCSASLNSDDQHTTELMVCNAVYVRLNWTQPLCACPSRYRDPCSASLNSDDQHTTELMVNKKSKALTLVKTCEMTTEMRICRAPRDWSLLALQNIRTGKSHFLVICRCPDYSVLEGPMSHDQPTYASVPGIRVYGMMCVENNKRRGRLPKTKRSADHSDSPPFPWDRAAEFSKTVLWD